MEEFDLAAIKIEELTVVKKFDCKPDGTDWTQEELDSGAADEALAEVITLKNGVIVDTWKRE
jgi:hypothetical protein